MGLIKDILYNVSGSWTIPFFKKQPIFPYYHLVTDHDVKHIKHLYQFKTVDQFREDIDFLTKNYKAIDPGDLLQGKLDPNTFLLTFDDGLKEIYTEIYPILKEKNLSAIFFVNPNFIDNQDVLYKHLLSVMFEKMEASDFETRYLDEMANIFAFKYTSTDDFKRKFLTIKFSDRVLVDAAMDVLKIDKEKYLRDNEPYVTKNQIQEMLDNGFYFGGHTMSHPPLHELSVEEQRLEIINSIDWLKRNFSIDYSLFAFPFSDQKATKGLIASLFKYDSNILLFGNSGLKKDFDHRIIQRFSLEHPDKNALKQVGTENLYKLYNRLTNQYNIKRANGN